MADIIFEYYAVLDEQNLGYIMQFPSGYRQFNFLHASILHGSYYNAFSSIVPIYPDTAIRKATEEDFDVYRCCLPYDFKLTN